MKLLTTILIAGATCGVLDLICALLVFKAKGVPPGRALQGIASAALGAAAFEGGGETAALGILFHFAVAISAATVYCFATARFRFLLEHPFLVGPLYGIAVHLFMTFLVLPLSRINRHFSLGYFMVQLVIHMFAVGLPIALVAQKCL